MASPEFVLSAPPPRPRKPQRVEVSPGVYMEGKDLEDYCHKRGKCTICAKVKVRRKVVKVFGKSNTWEPITAVKVPRTTEKGIRGKRKTKSNYHSVKARIESGNDDSVEYLVYKGFCVREGCYTLDQAKRLADCAEGKGIAGGGLPPGKMERSMGSNRSLKSDGSNSNSTNRRRTKFGGFLRKAASGNNPFFSPKHSDKSPLLMRVGENSPMNKGSILSPSFRSSFAPPPTQAPSDEVSSTITGEVSCLTGDESQTNNNNTSPSSVVPSPQVRRNFDHDFSSPDSPKKRFHSRDLYEGSVDGQSSVGSRPSLPMREIVQRTVTALQKDPSRMSAIHTIDLTGLRFRRSEMEALARMFRVGKNATIHLTSLVLDNCGIDDELLGILGHALYDALFAANPYTSKNKYVAATHPTATTSTTADKTLKHAHMKLRSLYLGDNDIGNEGIEGLCPFLESIACELENLDLSRNRIETEGGAAIFNAFRRNPQTRIQSIDLSCNLLRKLDDTTGGEEENDSAEEEPHSAATSPTSATTTPSGTTSGFGQSLGIKGFLAKNRTLQKLDLSANRMTDDGVEAVCGGLAFAGNRTVLQKLNLGFNRIGDDGASAIAKCLGTNQSLELIELNDNHIENDGGLALLAAIETNTTLKEITGLWSNKIDRRYIIVSVRQMLVSPDRKRKMEELQRANSTSPGGGGDHSDHDIYISADSESTIQTKNGPGKANSTDGDDPAANPSFHSHTPVGNDNCDDNVSELSDHTEDDLSDASYEKLMQENVLESDIESVGMMETNQEVTHNLFDRITVMNSSPLVASLDDHGSRKPIPLHDTRKESDTIRSATQAHHLSTGSSIDVRNEVATVEKLKAFLSRPHDSAVLHLSCDGVEGDSDTGIALENGYGSLETLSLSDLTELVAGAGDTLDVVFVSSSRSVAVGQAFVDAGVAHVICCQRDDDAFRDFVALEFIESFYGHAAERKSLRESFDAAVRAVIASPKCKNRTQLTKRFRLLPSVDVGNDGTGDCHDEPIFFQKFIPNTHAKDTATDPQQWQNIHPLPDHFIGREVEVFKLLESLQVDDCVEISGDEGCGKNSVVAAALQYALNRKETFSIDEVCWIPAPKHAILDTDSLYGDLILCCDLIRNLSEDLWDRSEEILDCRYRLALHLEEDHNVVVVIDDRNILSEGSRSALRKMIHFIATYTSAAKVISISTSKETAVSDPGAKTSRIEIEPLPFRPTVLLFGHLSEHISKHESTMVRSANELLQLADIPFTSSAEDPSGLGSKRRADILERIGNGFPMGAVTAANVMTQNDFDELMKVVGTPELRIDTLNELESEITRWKSFVELAVEEKNYKRAVDLHATIDALDGMRLKFCSLKDLKAKERSMKMELAEAISNRRYDRANELKRDLLDLKKKIMKERRISTSRLVETPTETLKDIKAKVDSLANKINNDESFNSVDETRSFEVDCDGHSCIFLIYTGSIFDTQPSPRSDSNDQARCIVCWTSEACELEGTPAGKSLLELSSKALQESIDDLRVLETTRYGPVRCTMGSALVPRTIPSSDGEIIPILAVGPFANPSGRIDSLLERDKDYRRFGMSTLRSCYRACMNRSQVSKTGILVVQPLSTRNKTGMVYKETLLVALQTLANEAKYSKELREVHIASRTTNEASLLAGIMHNMGHSPFVKDRTIGSISNPGASSF